MGEIRIDIDGATIAAAQLAQAAAELPGDDVVYAVGTPVSYAPYQEFGTAFHAAQPYMRPAVNKTRREMDSIVDSADSMEAAIAEMARRVRDRSKDEAPVETGRLRDSIRMERRK